MMTDVVVAPSLGGVLVGCVLLTGTVPVVVVVSTVWGGEVVLICEGVVSSGVDAVERQFTCNRVFHIKEKTKYRTNT